MYPRRRPPSPFWSNLGLVEEEGEEKRASRSQLAYPSEGHSPSGSWVEAPLGVELTVGSRWMRRTGPKSGDEKSVGCRGRVRKKSSLNWVDNVSA